MSERSERMTGRLDKLEAEMDRRPEPRKLLPELREVLSSLPDGSNHRPRALRLSGAIKNRLKLYPEALADLGEAKAIAMAQRDHRELAAIGREISVVYAWRGDDRAAALELLHALALVSLEGDRGEIARMLAEFGRIELEARRFDRVVVLLRLFADTAAQDLPPREIHRVTINLCQALNHLGEHTEALDRIGKLQDELPAADMRLRFLSFLEEARALAGLGRNEAAEDALGRARELVSETESGSFERTENMEVEAELKLLRQDPSALEDLKAVAEEFTDQELIVRATNVHLTLADRLFVGGQDELAREILSDTLRNALNANMVDLADRIRSAMIKSAGAGQLAELAETVELVRGQSSLNRRFILLGQLGKGGFGEVHKALDLSDGQHVALKRLNLNAYSETSRKYITETIKTEYGVALSLVHPGFARVRDLLIEPGGTLYIVQDFIDGPTLRQIYNSQAGPEHLLSLLADVADALGALHAKGIVHRDLKPENVVVRDNNSPVLIDLGIASVVGRDDPFKHVGTPGYIAPEQARGDNVDRRADIYALGKMIAEIWGGKSPSPFLFLRSRSSGEVMPQAISRLVRQMLRANPNRRLNDLELIAATLRNIANQSVQQTR